MPAGDRPRLAVVIPAWKGAFLREAVDSVLAQTGDFSLHIGDDASPEELRALLGERLDDPRVHYVRFEENKGGTCLCSQWERCVDLAGEAEWIWLFSDDDVMGPGCIEAFLRATETCPDAHLFRFPVSSIDESGAVLREFPLRDFETSEQMLTLRLSNLIDSFVVEYVFRRSEFLRQGRFQKFDLAWGSDDATWMKLMEAQPSKLLRGGRVFWRKSRLNISPDERNTALTTRKVRARVAWLKWVCGRYPWFVQSPRFGQLSRRWFLRNMEVRGLGYGALMAACKQGFGELGWTGHLSAGCSLVLRRWFDRLGNRLAGKPL